MRNKKIGDIIRITVKWKTFEGYDPVIVTTEYETKIFTENDMKALSILGNAFYRRPELAEQERFFLFIDDYGQIFLDSVVEDILAGMASQLLMPRTTHKYMEHKIEIVE